MELPLAKPYLVGSTQFLPLFSTHEAMDVFNPGDRGSTFGGNLLAAAVGMAALDVIVEEQLSDRGAYFVMRLCEIVSPHIQEV